MKNKTTDAEKHVSSNDGINEKNVLRYMFINMSADRKVAWLCKHIGPDVAFQQIFASEAFINWKKFKTVNRWNYAVSKRVVEKFPVKNVLH